MLTKARRKRDPLAKLKKEDPTTATLYAAVNNYVVARGGSVVVIGGVETQEWPGDAAGKFRLAVHFLGRKPSLEVRS